MTAGGKRILCEFARPSEFPAFGCGTARPGSDTASTGVWPRTAEPRPGTQNAYLVHPPQALAELLVHLIDVRGEFARLERQPVDLPLTYRLKQAKFPRTREHPPGTQSAFPKRSPGVPRTPGGQQSASNLSKESTASMQPNVHCLVILFISK
jgi:hypothetical protein